MRLFALVRTDPVRVSEAEKGNGVPGTDYVDATRIRASRALARTVQVDQAYAVLDWVWLIQRALNYPGGEEGGVGGKG
jgi:hypothetical protein